MKILIIDDEQGILDLYKEGLTSQGFEVLTANSGQLGIDAAKKEKPEAILLDIIMPQLNGLDVLKAIKADSEIGSIPVYLLTNLPEDCSGGKAKELGAAGYFVKAQYEPKTIAQVLSKK